MHGMQQKGTKDKHWIKETVVYMLCLAEYIYYAASSQVIVVSVKSSQIHS